MLKNIGAAKTVEKMETLPWNIELAAQVQAQHQINWVGLVAYSDHTVICPESFYSTVLAINQLMTR